MASHEQFLEDYEISRLVSDSNDSQDDKHSGDDFGLSGSEDEEDAAEEDLDDDIDSLYDVADTGDHEQPENTDVEHSETGESTDEETNVFQGKDFTWGRTPPKVARARRENIIVHLLSSVIRFDDKATRTERRLEDKMAAFREIWDKSVGLCQSLYLVGSAVCINEQLLRFRGRSGFRQYMQKKPSKCGIKTWMMCDCVMNYTMNAKVYLGKENNEVAHGLASDVVCKLVQPISGQDRGGRNVTVDNFFTSVDLANQLKNKKLTLVGTMKQNRREIPQEFKPARQRDENSTLFWI